MVLKLINMLTLLLLWLPFVFTLSVLAYACVYDFKERQVSNKIWLLAYPAGIMITLTQVMLGLIDGSVVLVSVLSCVGLGVVLFWSGYYGGADLKALLFIALTAPSIPTMHLINPIPHLLSLPLILIVFCNSALLSLVWPLTIFVLNLKDALKGNHMFEGIQLTLCQKIWLFFTSRCIPLDKLGGLRYFPSETVAVPEEADGKPARKMIRFVKAETNLKKYIDNLQAHKELYQNGVLASPTIPTMIFFTLALAIAPLCI